MKSTNYIVCTIIILCSITITAQTTAYNPAPTDHDEIAEYNSDYQNYKKLYLKKLDSEYHYNLLNLSKQFVEKMNHPEKLDALLYVNNDPLNYIKKNFSTTSFESFEAAVAEWAALTTAMIDEWQHNSEYYAYDKKIKKRWGLRLIADVKNEVAMEFPEKFNLLNR